MREVTRAAAGPDHELGREDDAAVLVLGWPVGLIEQEFGRRASELVLGLADRRERHGRVRGELDVVVADDREVSRHAHARLAQPTQQAQREHVVGAEHRGRLVLRAAEQAVGGGSTARGFIAGTGTSVRTWPGSSPACSTAR